MRLKLCRRAIPYLVAAVFLVSLLALPATRTAYAAQTSTVTLYPTDNTFIDSAFATDNYASYNIMGALSYSGSSGTRTEQSWLKFDISGIPSGVTITSASLTLSLWYTSVVQSVGVYGESSNSWSESTIDWSIAPLGSVSGSSVGSNFVTNSTLSYTWNVASLVASSLGSMSVSMVVQPTSQQSSDVNGWSNFFTTRYGGSTVPSLTITYSLIPQSSVTMGYSLIGGGAGYSEPILTYVSGGVQQTTKLTTSPTVYKMDSGSAWTVSQTLGGSSSTERWRTTQATGGTVEGSFSQNFVYYHQYSLTISYSVAGGGSPSPPALTYVGFGSSLDAQISTSPQTFWGDSGSFASTTNPLVGSTSSERWYSTSPNGTLSEPMTVIVNYTHEYSLTAAALPPTCSQLTTCSQASEYSAWEAAGSQYSENVSAVFGRVSGVGYRFTSITIDNGSPQTFPATLNSVPLTLTMNSPHTIVLTTVKQYQVALDANAAKALSSITSPTIPGDQYWYDSGSQVNVVLNGVWERAAGTGTRLASYSVNGVNATLVSSAGTIGVLSISSISSPQVVNVTVVTQYQLSTSSGAVASATSPAIAGDSGWYDSGTQVTVNYDSVWNLIPQKSRMIAAGYTIDGGSLTTVPTSVGATFVVSVTMDSAHTIGIQSLAQFYISFKVTDASGSRVIMPSDFQISAGGKTLDVPSLGAFLNNGTTFSISKVSYEGLDVKPTSQPQYSVSSPSNLTIKAQVYDATIKVADVLGIPVSGAAVRMTLANGTTISGTTGGDGTFTVPSIPLGTYSASVTSIGSSAQFTGDASKQAVTLASVLFSTISLGLIVAVVVIAIGAALFLLRRRPRARPVVAAAQQTVPKISTCPKCGAAVGSSETFCENCGTKLR